MRKKRPHSVEHKSRKQNVNKRNFALACFGWMRRLPWQMRNSIAKRARQCGHRWASLAEWIAPELKGE